jgi:hypothetical protein
MPSFEIRPGSDQKDRWGGKAQRSRTPITTRWRGLAFYNQSPRLHKGWRSASSREESSHTSNPCLTRKFMNIQVSVRT